MCQSSTATSPRPWIRRFECRTPRPTSPSFRSQCWNSVVQRRPSRRSFWLSMMRIGSTWPALTRCRLWRAGSTASELSSHSACELTSCRPQRSCRMFPACTSAAWTTLPAAPSPKRVAASSRSGCESGAEAIRSRYNTSISPTEPTTGRYPIGCAAVSRPNSPNFRPRRNAHLLSLQSQALRRLTCAGRY